MNAVVNVASLNYKQCVKSVKKKKNAVKVSTIILTDAFTQKDKERKKKGNRVVCTEWRVTREDYSSARYYFALCETRAKQEM